MSQELGYYPDIILLSMSHTNHTGCSLAMSESTWCVVGGDLDSFGWLYTISCLQDGGGGKNKQAGAALTDRGNVKFS